MFCVFRKIISIEIIDRVQYQRNETFLIRLCEPSLVRDDELGSLRMYKNKTKKPSRILIDLFLAMTEEEKLIAELGKPRLGEKNIIRVRIRESKEFKVNGKLFCF